MNNILGRLFGTKRYNRSGNTIIDRHGMTYMLDLDDNVWLHSTNPEVKISAKMVNGWEAVVMWDDLVNRVNDKNHPYYYE